MGPRGPGPCGRRGGWQGEVHECLSSILEPLVTTTHTSSLSVFVQLPNGNVRMIELSLTGSFSHGTTLLQCILLARSMRCRDM